MELFKDLKGLCRLMCINVFSVREAAGHNSSDYIHVFVEAVRLAVTDGLCYLGDPDHVTVPLETLLDKSYSRQQAQHIRMDRCAFGFVCWCQCVPVVLC